MTGAGASDPFHLQRFRDAQVPVIDRVEAELAAGRKRSHWMWFVFPQLRALGRSETALFYGIASLAEARAYLADPLLGDRIRRLTELAIAADAPSLTALFGTPDDLKFRSSMTLFAVAGGAAGNVFERALTRWCGGDRDAATLDLLAAD
ncbi:DUF1810 domain-containing protein [Kaistia geumhonensis]|uniref:Uncharacterized protein (DUF1810 family) n=1 Tax=Kaistia geumhonensis TaxID=410839 RepID=A0ABU0M7V5_9HYPH|nr:DUF1810 domain-containing protein [Kaistia geumhonensis]MCX5477744.1 DUF1810 domain-containing protein [Kaistia geumhonensis]MDQ0517045.1 uncharacterized protein (DUF1810 family) [Kaistia geumhonensis]